MEGVGVACQTIGALLIAYSQFEINRTISMWFRSLDHTVENLVSNPNNVLRIRGVDQHWDRDLKRDKWMSTLGWTLIVLGEIIVLWHLATTS